MKTITKIRLLKSLGLFNITRFLYYQFQMLNPKTTAFYANFVVKGSLCFDIGANIGRKTDIFLKLGAAKIILVEPNPECVQFLKWKYGKNERIVIIPKAISDKEEIKEMRICEANSLSSLSSEWIEKAQDLRYQQFQWNTKIQVSTTTLDQLIKQFGLPDFCKIDVEGYELFVLQGLHQTVPIISFEFSPETLLTAKRCIQYLNQLNNAYFNYSEGERPEKLSLQEWLKADDLIKILEKNSESKYGEIYASSLKT
jgi:FkbM family methyltransferase